MVLGWCDFCKIYIETLDDYDKHKMCYEKERKNEKIDGPKHYNGYQVIDAIWNAGYGEGFCLGNVVKYILRAKKKDNHEEDLKKAEWYLNYYMDKMKLGLCNDRDK